MPQRRRIEPAAAPHRRGLACCTIWFLLSLLLGPIATLLIVLSGSRQPIWDDHTDSIEVSRDDYR